MDVAVCSQWERYSPVPFGIVIFCKAHMVRMIGIELFGVHLSQMDAINLVIGWTAFGKHPHKILRNGYPMSMVSKLEGWSQGHG